MPWTTREGTLERLHGHVQGMCVSSNAVFMTLHNGLYKFDWGGNLIRKVSADIHQGDVCLWDGRLYVAVDLGDGQRGRIDVYDIDLNWKTNAAISKPADGIVCLDGVLYVGLGPVKDSRQSFRGNWFGKFDAKTLTAVCEPFVVDHGFASTAGVQNIATDGRVLYVNFYTPEMGVPCFFVFDRNFNVLGYDVFGWRQGLDVISWPDWKDKDAVLFTYVSTLGWPRQKKDGSSPPQALMQYAAWKDGRMQDISERLIFTHSPSYWEQYRHQKMPGLARPSRVNERQTLWRAGDNGVKSYRIPALATAPNGDLIAACDARKWHGGDLNTLTPINISLRRSHDGGRTWTSPVDSKTWPWKDGAKWSGSDPSLVVDREAGKVFLFYNVWDWTHIPNGDDRLGIYRFFVQESSDNGATWSDAREITHDIAPDGWPVGKTKGEGACIFIPSGSGVQLKDGMLLHTLAWVGKSVSLFGSVDHGRIWRAVGRPTRTGDGDECKVVELSDGRWMLNQRWHGGYTRFVNVSDDHGQTWSPREDKSLTDPRCNGQLMRYGTSLLFSNCASTCRENIRIRRSDDNGCTWDEGVCVCPGKGMYSDMAELPDGKVGILYEEGAGPEAIRFAVVSGF